MVLLRDFDSDLHMCRGGSYDEKLDSDECVMDVQRNSELRYQGIVDGCLASIIDSPFHRIPCLGHRIRVRKLDHN